MRHGSPLFAFHSGERRIDLDTPSSTFQRLNNLRPVLATIIAEFPGHLLWPHRGHFVCFLFPSACKRDGQSTDALKITLARWTVRQAHRIGSPLLLSSDCAPVRRGHSIQTLRNPVECASYRSICTLA